MRVVVVRVRGLMCARARASVCSLKKLCLRVFNEGREIDTRLERLATVQRPTCDVSLDTSRIGIVQQSDRRLVSGVGTIFERARSLTRTCVSSFAFSRILMDRDEGAETETKRRPFDT